MKTNVTHPSRGLTSPARLAVCTLAVCATLVLPWLAGCANADTTALPAFPAEPVSQTLRPGDVVKISFPRASTLDTTQQIRRDGKINLYLVGEVDAAGHTPAELEKQLMDKYAAQLVSKEVRVTVVSSAFTVYVAGAVLHPGRISPDRDITLMEAVMEAGGFDTQKANLKAVSVIRREGQATKNYVLDLQSMLDGTGTKAFPLQPDDIVYVPERRSIF